MNVSLVVKEIRRALGQTLTTWESTFCCLSFSLAILFASLWALSTEMVEDAFVDLSYGTLFGWSNLLKGMLISGAILISASFLALHFALGMVGPLLQDIRVIGGLLLTLVGAYWLYGSITGRHGIFDEIEEAKQRVGGVGGRLTVVTQLVMVEELEIVLIVMPLIASSHALEASVSTLFGITLSLALAALLRKRFEQVIIGRMRYLKFASGMALLFMGLLILF